MYTPLMAVCCSSHYSEEGAEAVVAALLAAGASPTAADRHRCTPLIYAAKEGRSGVVRQLVAAGAETGRQDTMGWTVRDQDGKRWCEEERNGDGFEALSTGVTNRRLGSKVRIKHVSMIMFVVLTVIIVFDIL